MQRIEYSLADTIERRVESPLQRFVRLRQELSELKSDLDVMVYYTQSNCCYCPDGLDYDQDLRPRRQARLIRVGCPAKGGGENGNRAAKYGDP
jgi:hypothetical protein